MREEIGDTSQGGVVPLPGEFLSGAHRLRHNPHDGHLYVAGTSGWISYAKEIGSLQRLRATGKPLDLPASVTTHENGLLVRFKTPINPESVQLDNVFVQQWNYVYSAGYGSPEFLPHDAEQRGHERVKVRSIHALPDGSSIFIEIPQLHPVMQMQIYLQLESKRDDSKRGDSKRGESKRGDSKARAFATDVYYTIKEMGEPFVDFEGYSKIVKDAAPDFPVSQPYERDPRLDAQEKVAQVSTKETVQLEIQALPGLRFEPSQLRVQPGQHVKLTVKNSDHHMQHNFVIVTEGKLKEIGEASMLLASDPKALGTNYVPDAPDSVWRFSPVLNPGDEYTIDFTAPEKTGVFPFVCTFPGHWQVMQGVLYVLDADDEIPAPDDSKTAQRQFVKMWKAEDLAGEMKRLSEGSVEKGRKIFQEAGCIKCHTIAGEGFKLGPDLTDVRKKFKGSQLLEQIINPSDEIHVDYVTLVVNTLDGRVFSGMRLEEDDNALRLLPNPLRPDKVTSIQLDNIGSALEMKKSTMPEHLLMTFTASEIQDLVLFLERGGQ